MRSAASWALPGAAIGLILVLSACGGGEPAGSADGAAGGAEFPRFLSIGTAPQGGAFYPVGGALAEVLNEHRGARDWTVTAEATKGSQENIRRLDSREIDLALANAAISYFAVRGEEGWDRAYDIRAVMTLAPNVAQFIAPADGDITELADLAGRRVAALPAGAGVPFFLNPILDAHGLSWDDIDWVPGPQSASAELLGDGAVDAAFLGGAVPTAAITQAATSRDVRLLPYDADAIASLTEKYVFFGPAVIPGGTYRANDDDFHGLDVGSMHLITHASTSDDVVYEIVKTIWENRDDVVARHAAGRAIRDPNVVRDTGVDFHPGAVRFYREIGVWPPDRE